MHCEVYLTTCSIGRAIRYRQSDLDAFMDATKVQSTCFPASVIGGYHE